MADYITSLPSITSDDEDQSTPKSFTQNAKRISFPADSILNAVIQDGDVVDLLYMLKYNRSEIDLNQTNHSGLTALHHAVLTNNLDMAKLLLNNGADVHVQDVHGLSPLHTAAALGHLQMTSFLILFGADVFCHTKHSERPLDLAKDLSVIRLLYQEMCFRIQQDLYLQTVFKLLLAKVLRFGCEMLMWILKVVLASMVGVYNTWLSLSRGLSPRDAHITGESATPIYTVGSTSTLPPESTRLSDQRDMVDKKRI